MKLVIIVQLFVALLCVSAGMRKSVAKINSVFKSRCRFSKILPGARIVQAGLFCFLGYILKHAKLTPSKREMAKFSKSKIEIRVKNSLNLAFKLNDITTKIATIEACIPGRFMSPQ